MGELFVREQTIASEKPEGEAQIHEAQQEVAGMEMTRTGEGKCKKAVAITEKFCGTCGTKNSHYDAEAYNTRPR